MSSFLSSQTALYANPNHSLVLCVDAQQRLCAALPDLLVSRVKKRIEALIFAANTMNIPVMVTEQYPKGLGSTLPEIKNTLLPTAQTYEKIEFSAMQNPNIEQAFLKTLKKQVIVVGMETHVCIFQTVRDLCAQGFLVHLACDAVLARHKEDHQIGLALCQRAGAVLSSTESIVFDWLGRAGTSKFKEISVLFKAFDRSMKEGS